MGEDLTMTQPVSLRGLGQEGFAGCYFVGYLIRSWVLRDRTPLYAFNFSPLPKFRSL
jgi:hypothetical protein